MKLRTFRKIGGFIWLPVLLVTIAAGPGVLVALILTMDTSEKPKPAHISVQDFCISQVLAPNLGDPETYGYNSVTTIVASDGTYKTTGLVLSGGNRRAFTCTARMENGWVHLINWTIH